MKNFLRYSKKRIVDIETKRVTSEKIIYLRYKRGEVASYKDAFNQEDLIPKLIQKNEAIKYAKRYTNQEETEFGPAKPINETKYYTCNSCENPTPNRFKCGACWEKISHISAGTIDEDNYKLADFSDEIDSYD